MCHKNNFVFIDHQNITSNDLWVDGIYLTNSGKAISTRGFVEKINEYLCQNSNFQRDFIQQIFDWQRAFSVKTINEKVSILTNTIINIVSNYAPNEVTIDDRDPPWINDKIKN